MTLKYGTVDISPQNCCLVLKSTNLEFTRCCFSECVFSYMVSLFSFIYDYQLDCQETIKTRQQKNHNWNLEVKLIEPSFCSYGGLYSNVQEIEKL